jgi:hypothetical protein
VSVKQALSPPQGQTCFFGKKPSGNFVQAADAHIVDTGKGTIETEEQRIIGEISRSTIVC